MSEPLSELPRPVGFVLGGGASLGAVQVGMLRALREHGVRPDMITGTSVGALNGAILAGHAETGLERLERTWSELDRHDVFPGNAISLMWRLGRSRTHAVESDGLAAMVHRALDVTTFEGLQIPLAVVAVDLATGREWVLDSGPLVSALLASAAIPGVYPSVTVQGHALVDGGVLANVPIRHAVDRGARSLVVLDTTVPAPLTAGEPRVGDVLARVNELQMRAQLQAALPAAAARLPLVYLPAPTPRRVSPMDFRQSAALVRDSYERSGTFLATLHIDGPGVYGDPYSRYVAGDPNAPAVGLVSTLAT